MIAPDKIKLAIDSAVERGVIDKPVDLLRSSIFFDRKKTSRSSRRLFRYTTLDPLVMRSSDVLPASAPLK
jgi:hypothetical protein